MGKKDIYNSGHEWVVWLRGKGKRELFSKKLFLRCKQVFKAQARILHIMFASTGNSANEHQTQRAPSQMIILMQGVFKCTPGLTWRDWAGISVASALQRKRKNDQQRAWYRLEFSENINPVESGQTLLLLLWTLNLIFAMRYVRLFLHKDSWKDLYTFMNRH